MTVISSQTTEALRQAHALVERDAALAALVTALDPGRTQSLHTLAGVVCRMLETHGSGLARVLAVARPPWDDRGGTLAVPVRTGCPMSQHRLYGRMNDLFQLTRGVSARVGKVSGDFQPTRTPHHDRIPTNQPPAG